MIDLRRLDHSPRFAVALVACLALPELAALGIQFINGYIPFFHEPVRVPLSWDMFANKVERCTLDWDRPIHAGKITIQHLQDLGQAIEWVFVYDRMEDYQSTIPYSCNEPGMSGAKSHLQCFLPSGGIIHHDFICP